MKNEARQRDARHGAAAPQGPLSADQALRWEQRAWVAMVACFLVLALLYTVVIPLRYGPDEPRHEAYVQRLMTKHALPGYDAEGRELDGAIVFHPPGYYLLLGPVWLATRGMGPDIALRAMRATSPLLIGLSLVFFGLGLARLFPQRRLLRLLAVGLMAFLPHVMLEAAVMNNDVLAIFMGSLMFWQYCRLEDHAPSRWESLAMGLTLAVFVNTKAQGLTVSPLWLIWLLGTHGWRGLGRREFWVSAAWCYLPLLLLGSPWYLHNLRVYGVPLIIAPGHEPRDAQGQIYAGGQLLIEGLLLLPTFWLLFGRGVAGLFQSFWAQIGWIPLPRERLIYWLLGLALAAAAVGVIWATRRHGWRSWPRALRLSWLTFALVEANILAIAIFKHIGWHQGGRYMVPLSQGLFAFLALGWLALSGERCAGRVLAGSVLAGALWLNVLCLHNLLTVLNPAFAPHWRPFG